MGDPSVAAEGREPPGWAAHPVRDGGGGGLVDQPAGGEALEREGRVDRVRLVAGDGVGEDVGGARGRLEAAGAPAAVDVEAGDRGLAEDRRAVGGHVDDAAPFPEHPHAAEDREDLADRRERVLDQRQAAALRVADVLVGARADDELALVGLADVGVDRVRHHDAGEDRLDRLGDQRLQRIATRAAAGRPRSP